MEFRNFTHIHFIIYFEVVSFFNEKSIFRQLYLNGIMANLGHFRPTLCNQLNKNENNRLIDTQKPFSRNPLSNFIREVIILGSMMVLRGVITEELVIFATNSGFEAILDF